MPGKKKKGNPPPTRITKEVTIPVRDNVPLSVFYPEEKRKIKIDTNYFDTSLSEADKNQIIKQFPTVQNKTSDRFYAEKTFLKINNGKKFQGAVALTLHFVGFFRFNSDFTYSKIKCVHIYDIYSIRIKQWNKTLLYCRIENNGSKNDEVLNVHVNSPDAVTFTQILYRNYMLSTVAYDSYETCDFRTYDSSLFPPFDNGLSPSQGYQLTYFCFCSRLKLPYNHEFTRFYHEHICNFDGFFDFSLIFDSTNLKPAIYAMMFVPYVMAIICHKVKIENISQSIELIIKRSNFLRALHLSGCDINQDGIRRMGDALVENLNIYKKRISKRDPKYADYQKKYPIPIPVQYWNFENNNLVDATSFFQGLKDREFTADVFYLSFSNCRINDITGLFSAISTNPHLHQIKYLYFNGNQKVGPEDMEVFINHLNYLADFVGQPEKKKKGVKKCLYERIGVSGKGKALEKLFQTLIEREYPIKELSLAGSTIDRKPNTQFYTSSRGANAIINYFNHANELELIDLSSIDCDKQDLSLILQGMNRSQMLSRIHVKLNNIKKSEKDYEPLLAVAKAFLYTDMDKWESLEFADNYLNAFELDFLLSIFLKMKNLKMLNISNNFHKDDRAISNVLFKLHELNLTKLYLAGSLETQRYLPNQAFDLLTKLIEQGRLEELDISENLMGDRCYEFVIEILNKCPNLHTLIVDQNKPKNFQLFDDAIHLVMSKKNITFFPFPSRDLMHIFHHCSNVKELDEEGLSQFRWYLINLRYDCIGKINTHRKKIGLPPQLPFQAVPELGEMVNEVHEVMKKLLQNIRFYIHGGVAIDIKVPLPYLHEFQEYANGRNITDFKPDYDPKEIIEKYHAEHIFKRIDESQVNKLYDADIITIRRKLSKAPPIHPPPPPPPPSGGDGSNPFSGTPQGTNPPGKGSGNPPGKGSGNSPGKGSGNSPGKGSGNPPGKGGRNGTGKGSGKGSGKGNGKGSGKGSGSKTSKDTGSVIRKGNAYNKSIKDPKGRTLRDADGSQTNPKMVKGGDYDDDYNNEESITEYEDNTYEHEESTNDYGTDDDERFDDYGDGDNEESEEESPDEYVKPTRHHSRSHGHGRNHKHNSNHHHSSSRHSHQKPKPRDDGDDDYDNEESENEIQAKPTRRKAVLRSPDSPDSPRRRIPTDDDETEEDDDYGDEESEPEYDDSNTDSEDPAYGLKPKRHTKPKIKEYDYSDDNNSKVRSFTGNPRDPISSSALDKSPPPYYRPTRK